MTNELKLGTEEFAKAMNEATRKTKEAFEKADFSKWKLMPLKLADERTNRAVLTWECGSWQDFIGILLSNGYEVTAKSDGIEIEVTWGDKE